MLAGAQRVGSTRIKSSGGRKKLSIVELDAIGTGIEGAQCVSVILVLDLVNTNQRNLSSFGLICPITVLGTSFAYQPTGRLWKKDDRSFESSLVTKKGCSQFNG